MRAAFARNGSESDNLPGSLLLKPTGVPVFTPVNATFNASSKDFQMTQGYSMIDNQSTLDSTIQVRDLQGENVNKRIVQAKSFVIGKKVENQTGISLIDLENITLPQDKQFPVKIIYVKPTLDRKQYSHNRPEQNDNISQNPIRKINNENIDSLNNLNLAKLELLNKNTQPKQLPLQKQFPKSNGVSDQLKSNEKNHRPQSAATTSQQIKKDQIKHSKLGPNTQVKPQISYVNKVAASQGQKLTRPQSAAKPALYNMLGDPKDDNKTKPAVQLIPANRFEKRIPSPPKVDVQIPFTQNRFQGKFGEMTKDLIKRAQDALLEEKQKAIQQKEEYELKKKKQKELAEEVKLKNMELVKLQKEKGGERYDPRKKEQEQLEQKRKEEAKMERDKQKELRRKRQEDPKKQLGLEIFEEVALKKHHDKIKEQQQKLKEEQELELKKKQNVEKPKDHLKDLNANNNRLLSLPELSKHQIDQSSKESLLQDSIDVQIDRKKLLEDQKRAMKQRDIDKKKKEEEMLREKQERMKNLEESSRRIREEISRKSQVKKQIQEQELDKQDQFQDNNADQEKSKKKSKKKNKNRGKSYQEQINELRGWIDQQLQKTDESGVDLSDIMPAKVKFQDASNDKIMNEDIIDTSANQIQVQIVKRNQKNIANTQTQLKRDNQENLFEIDSNSDMFTNKLISDKTNKQKSQSMSKQQARFIDLKNQIPGNSTLSYEEQLKHGVRDDRYGLFSDNGYGELIEIKQRKIENTQSKKASSVIHKSQQRSRDTSLINNQEGVSEQQANDIKLSKEGMVTLINKIQEYARQKEEEIFKQKIQQLEQENKAKQRLEPREVFNLTQKDGKVQPASQSVPGVVNIQQEAQKQKELQKKKESKATLIIQKWSRGYIDRQRVREIRFEKQIAIETEYGYFEDQVKFNSGYNLQKFLKENQKLREQNKTQRLAESQSIQEKIGMDSSNSQSFSQNQQHQQSMNKLSIRGRSAPAQGTVQTSSVQQPQMNNFLREKSDKDPLSLIEIFARKNAPKIVPSVVKSPIRPQHPSDVLSQSHSMNRSRAGINSSQQQLLQPNRIRSGSDIDEDIYTESFERDEDQKSVKTDIVEDDLAEGSKGFSSSSMKDHPANLAKQNQQQIQRKPFEYKQSTQIIEEESIQEDLMMSMGARSFKSPNQRRGDDSSIAEDSILQQQSISRSSHQKRSSLREDSIEEEIEGVGTQSDDKILTAKMDQRAVAVRAEERKKQLSQHEIQVKEFEIKIRADEEKRQGYVNEMLDEMKRYEQASMQTVVVERLEKIITQSLAQKDKILLGQRLHQLEQEKQHKDEINKIREEQIRLLSQLVLLGPNGASGIAQTDEERKQILENIQKIIEKPIVIQHQQQELEPKKIQSPPKSKKQPKIVVSSSEDYGVEEDLDEIEESKRQDDDDSIKESIQMSADDEEEIKESIPEDIESESNDEIKESIHIDGRKLKDEKIAQTKRQEQNQKANMNNNYDNELQKMRLALGSEESLRKQSKNALKRSKGGDRDNNQLKNSGIFEKNSFQDFTNQKFKQFLFDQNALNEVKVELEKAIEEKKQEKEERIKKKLLRNEISPRTFKKHNQEIEKWVHQERKELKKKQKKFVQSMTEMNQYLKQMDMDKKSMIEKIGSPRPLSSRSNQIQSQSSAYDHENSSGIQESSDESLRVRQARDQIRKITFDMNKDDPEAKAIVKKRKAAQKLLAEKEKAIEEGLKNKLKEIEQQQADKMLDLALNLDINQEINKRISGARRAIEESSDHFNDYCARSYSQSVGGFVALSTSEDPNKKGKKNVKFASPEKYSSAHSHSMDQSSGGDRSSRFKSSQKFDDSIGESIKIDESQSVSGDVTHKMIESSKRSMNSHSNNKIHDSIKESIKESARESIPEDSQDYSDDFVQSMASDLKSNNKALEQSRNKLIQKVNTVQDQENDEIDYSMNFDDSIGQSQQLQRVDQSQKMQNKHVVNQVDEESDEDDQNDQQKSQNKDSQKDSDDVGEEVMSESLGTSSKLISHQEIADSAQDQFNEDKEIVQSSNSVEWVINLEGGQLTQRSQKQRSDGDQYSEDFEKIEEEDYYDQDQQDVAQLDKDEDAEEEESEEEEDDDESKQMDDLDDLESFPDELADSMDDYNQKVDRITDEFLELFLNEIRENQDLKLADNNFNIEEIEEDFKDKFPFNLIKEEEVKEIQPPEGFNRMVTKEEKKEVKKPTLEDEIRQKYESEVKKMNDQTKSIESYIKLLTQTIDKRDLIDLLEKPIENDPLQKLAFIYQMDDLQNQNNSGFNILNDQASQTILSLDFFMNVEDKYRKEYGQSLDKDSQVDLTESARQGQLRHETAHHKAIFDAFNQALDIERPYKEKGQPAPWSKQTRVVRPRITESEVEKILKKCADRVMIWCNTHAGTSLAPIPPAPPSDLDNQANQPPIQSEEDRKNQAREEKLGLLMMRELEENENKWIDYENEDAQVKIDLADQVLDQLTAELAEIMMGLRKY